MKFASLFLSISILAACSSNLESKKQIEGAKFTVTDTVRSSVNPGPAPLESAEIRPFRLVKNYPRINDTAAFIRELRSACRVDVDDDVKSNDFREQITYYKRVKLNGSNDDFILTEYDYGDGCMAAYPWKYQFVFRPNGELVKYFYGVRFQLLHVSPKQNPYLLILTASAKGNGGHELYRINHDTLENVYESYYDYATQTYDDHDDNAVYEPRELNLSAKDMNGDRLNDLVFSGTIVLTQGRTAKGLWYDCEDLNDKKTCYSLEHPFKKAPIEFVFLYDKASGHFKAKEDYDKKYKEYHY